MTATIRAHNEGAAAVWGSGGSAYDKVSETIADALDHVVARLNPQTRREMPRCGNRHWLDGKTSQGTRRRCHGC